MNSIVDFTIQKNTQNNQENPHQDTEHRLDQVDLPTLRSTSRECTTSESSVTMDASDNSLEQVPVIHVRMDTCNSDSGVDCPICQESMPCTSRPITYSAELNRLVYADLPNSVEIADKDCSLLHHLFEIHQSQICSKKIDDKGKPQKCWSCPMCEYSSPRKCNLEAHLLMGQKLVSKGTHHSVKHFYCLNCGPKMTALYNVQSASCHFKEKHNVVLEKKTRGRSCKSLEHFRMSNPSIQSQPSAQIVPKEEEAAGTLLRLASSQSLTSLERQARLSQVDTVKILDEHDI